MADRPTLSRDGARAMLASARTKCEPVPLRVRIATGERTQRLFRAAAAEADALQHPDIGLPHILLAMLREPDSIAPLLERMGVPVQTLRDDAARMLAENCCDISDR
jgi:hypothetical protein